MGNDIRITLVQTSLFWEHPRKNRVKLESALRPLKGETDLVVLPEMFTTGFSMQAEKLAEAPDGPTLKWMGKISGHVNADLTGSWIVKEKDNYYNRLYWINKDGQVHYYDKRHLFRMAGEEKIFSGGNRLLTVTVNNWKIRPLICYDLRFPLWARNQQNAYDLLVYVANWPESRIDHWKMLLQARAVENQSYVAGVNRVGIDAQSIHYGGHSLIVNPLGAVLLDMCDKDGPETVELSRATMETYRRKFPVWKDADNFRIE